MKYFGLSVLVLLVSLSCSKPKVIGDILIQNGIIYNGTDQSAFESDLIVKGDKILWIGEIEDIRAVCDLIIDASGKVVSPGFMDIHAHGDPLATPIFQNFLAMGVTSIALGMDGFSKEVKDIRHWLRTVDKEDLGVNILPFIGHGTIRRESGIENNIKPSELQLDSLISLLKIALDQGVWGLSFGLEYLPGIYSDSIELAALAKTVGLYEAVITSHIRNEDDDAIFSSLEEMFILAQFCDVNISHLKVVYGKGKERAREVLNLFEKYDKSDHTITADLYPYSASYTGIGILFPEWAKRPKTYGKIKQSRREELLNHLRKRVMSRNGPEATLFGTAPYKGRTLKDLEEEYNIPFEEVLADVVGPYGGSAAYFVMDEELQKELVKSDMVMIASDGSATMHHPRGHGTFAKVIEDFTQKENVLKLENAIYKMTGQPAETLGLKDRGFLKEGMKADVLIFDPKEIRNRATFDNPHQLAEGMNMVIVNGEIALKNGEVTSQSGKVLLKQN